MNNGVVCADDNPGTPDAPLCTVQAALNHLSGAGDAAILHTGIYPECAALAKSGVHGTPEAPIRIQGATGEDPRGIVIDASLLSDSACPSAPGTCDPALRRAALTIKGSWSGNVAYLRISDVTVRPTNLATTVTKNNGIDLQCVDHVELVDVRSDSQPAFSATDSSVEVADAVINAYNAKHVLIDRADISNGGNITPGFQAIALQDGGTSDVTILRSRVRDVSGGFVCESGGVRRVEIIFNDVAHIDAQCDGFNVVQAYNVDYIRMSYNHIVDHLSSIVRPRSYSAYSNKSSLVVSHNVFRARGSGQNAIQYGYAADADAVGIGLFKDNVFVGYANAFKFERARVRNCEFVEDGDAFLDTGAALSDASGCGFVKSRRSITGSVGSLISSDCPIPSSPLIDKGDVTGATPLHGSRMPDIGACESGELSGAWIGGYDFKPQDACPNASPRITWDGADDVNVNLKDLDFIRFLRGAPQTDFECEVDSVVTFNSLGIGKPVWASGRVSSSNPFCEIGVSLPPGDYFARVRLNGQFWSGLFKFSIGAGATVPPASITTIERGDKLPHP